MKNEKVFNTYFILIRFITSSVGELFIDSTIGCLQILQWLLKMLKLCVGSFNFWRFDNYSSDDCDWKDLKWPTKKHCEEMKVVEYGKLKMYIVVKIEGRNGFVTVFYPNGFVLGSIYALPNLCFRWSIRRTRETKITPKNCLALTMVICQKFETTIVNQRWRVKMEWRRIPWKTRVVKTFYDQYNLIVDDSNPKLGEFSEWTFHWQAARNITTVKGYSKWAIGYMRSL